MTTTKERAAMQQALEALESCEEDYIYDGENEYECDSIDWDKRNEAITALREALAGDNMTPTEQVDEEGKITDYMLGFSDGKHYAHKYEQAEQEPVAWWHPKMGAYDNNYFDAMQPLYLSPARTKDLTDDEISDVFDSVGTWKETLFGDLPVVFARAVIAAYKEKNK